MRITEVRSFTAPSAWADRRSMCVVKVETDEPELYGLGCASFCTRPTAVAAAGAEPPSDRVIDGVDLTPFATGKARGDAHDALFWRSGDLQVVMADGWKLQVDGRQDKRWLYQLDTDPTEQRNLAEAEPERVRELQDRLDAFNRISKKLKLADRDAYRHTWARHVSLCARLREEYDEVRHVHPIDREAADKVFMNAYERAPFTEIAHRAHLFSNTLRGVIA